MADEFGPKSKIEHSGQANYANLPALTPELQAEVDVVTEKLRQLIEVSRPEG